MRRTASGWIAAFVLLAAVLTGCQERLTAPADCPELCPGGQSRVFDTIITPIPNSDTSYVGFVSRQSAPALLVSNGLAASEDRAIMRFGARPDSVELRDTLRGYVLDSVRLRFNVVARDTLLNGLKLYIYRIDPAVVETTTTFADIAPLLIPTAILDSIAVPDTLNTGAVQLMFRGADLAKVTLPEDGVLALGVSMAAPQPSGVRLGALAASGNIGPLFTSFITLDIPDTGAVRRQTIDRGPALNAFVTQTPLVPDPAFLTVGGEPSSRSLLRFDLPQLIEDSGTIIRATLELVPRDPLQGLSNDQAIIQGIPLLADLGAKSPLSPDTRLFELDTLPISGSDTVRLDVTSIVQFWQASEERPEAIFLSLFRTIEGASFTRPVFGSTRSGTVGPPRLRVTYLKPFPFETP